MRNLLNRFPNVLAIALLVAIAFPANAEPLQVIATSPDLADLARSIGGDAVDVKALGKGPQDMHFVEPRPSFIRALHRADALVLNGMELEIGWLPPLLRSARNPDVVRRGSGYIDASAAIEPLEVPTGAIDRAMGDVHPFGNPHYLTDPLNGLAVAGLLRDRFSALAPSSAATFQTGYETFAARVAEALFGAKLAAETPADVLAQRLSAGELAGAPDLGGWLGRARDAKLGRAVQDHRYWSYFAARFGLEVVETLEPRPGIAPTTAHLQQVIERIRAEEIPVLLTTPYFDPRHARFVSGKTGTRIAPLAHQVGAMAAASDYVAMIDHNVRVVFIDE